MQELFPLLTVYLAAINAAAFALYGWDKWRAKVPGARRIPERTLLGIALLGGSLGAILGMRVFRHKTRHKKFSCGLPLILLVQLAFLFRLELR